MKRWVIKHDDGSLDINTTDGHEPVGCLCEAHEDWVVDEISYGGGVVYIDPEKIKAKREALILEAKKLVLKKRLSWIKKNWRNIATAVAIFAVGIFIGRL